MPYLPRLFFRAFCFLVFIAPRLADAAPPPDWSRFRGPNGSGIGMVENLPSTWTEQDYRWKASLPGSGHASPVISQGKVFVLCSDKTTAKRILVCLATGAGRALWQREFDSTAFQKNRDNSYATSTPAVDSQRIYVYWTTPQEVTMLALNHSGEQVWRRNLGPFKSQHGSGTSPIVYEDLVILNNDQEGPSSLLALDAKTGVTRWQVPRRKDRAAYATPCVRSVQATKSEVIFSSSAHGVTAVDPQTGRVNWELTNAFPFRVVGSPVLAGDLILGACGEGGVGRRVVAVRPPAGGRGAESAYDMKSGIPYVPTPLFHAGLVYLWGDNGLVVCCRAATGERLWQTKISDSFYGSPVFAAGRLYCVSKSGKVYALAAGEKPEILGSSSLGEPSFATPAVADDALFIRTESHLYCLPARPAAELP
jgi:outer membrane protein assembly factor BamB